MRDLVEEYEATGGEPNLSTVGGIAAGAQIAPCQWRGNYTRPPCGCPADAEIDRLRAENERLRETLRGIRDASWRTWDNATADEFVAWAQSRARHVLADHADAYMDAPVTASERTAVASKHQRPNV